MTLNDVKYCYLYLTLHTTKFYLSFNPIFITLSHKYTFNANVRTNSYIRSLHVKICNKIK